MFPDSVTKIRRLAELIARYEGFYVMKAKAGAYPYGTVSQRFNNPGNLEFERQPGATPEDVIGRDNKVHVYAKFKTVGQGWNALLSEIALNARNGLTLQEYVNKHVTNDYLILIATLLHADPNQPLLVAIREIA